MGISDLCLPSENGFDWIDRSKGDDIQPNKEQNDDKINEEQKNDKTDKEYMLFLAKWNWNKRKIIVLWNN